MKCRTIRRRLSAHLDGELDGWEDRLVSSHLSVCERCREELAGLEGVDRKLFQCSETGRNGPPLQGMLERLAGNGAADRASSPVSGSRRLRAMVVKEFWGLLGWRECFETGSLSEFDDFPPLLLSGTYFRVLSTRE